MAQNYRRTQTKHRKAKKGPSSETQGRLAGARGNKSDKEMMRRWVTSKAEKALLVNQRRFISLSDLFPLAPANRPWVSEDEMGQGWTKLGRTEMDYIWVNLKNVGPPFFQIYISLYQNVI